MSVRWLGGIGMLSLLLSGAEAHGLEFLLAKVMPTAGGTVRVEVSADYTANPLISDEAAAQAVIASVLHFQQGKHERMLGEGTGYRFAKTQGIDTTCPVKIPPVLGGGEHELMTGSLDERVEGTSFQLRIPQGNPYDVVLWVADEQGQALPGQHWYLIGGDDPITVQMPSQSLRWWIIAGVVAVVAALGIVVLARKRRIVE